MLALEMTGIVKARRRQSVQCLAVWPTRRTDQRSAVVDKLGSRTGGSNKDMLSGDMILPDFC